MGVLLTLCLSSNITFCAAAFLVQPVWSTVVHIRTLFLCTYYLHLKQHKNTENSKNKFFKTLYMISELHLKSPSDEHDFYSILKVSTNPIPYDICF